MNGMKKVMAIMAALLLNGIIYAQQIARATNIRLVSEPGVQLVSTGGITFTGTTSFTHRGSLTLLSNPVAGNSDWLDSTGGTGVFDATSSGHVLFRGTALLQQQIYGPTRFDTLTINNPGVHLRQSNEVRSRLNLTNGLVYFLNQADSLFVSNPALTAINYNTDSINTTSFVLGKLSRRANSTAAPYYFPIGKLGAGDSLYAPLKFEKTTAGAVTYSAQYFYAMPVNRTAKNALIDHISSVEYWEVTSHNFGGAGDDDATMSMSWRTQSVVSPTAIVRDSLLIAHYFNPGLGMSWEPEWVGPGSPIDVQGTLNFGFIRSNKVVTDYTMPHLNFTIGTRSINNILPVQFIDWTLSKQNRSALLTWQITDDREVDNYSIERSADGISFVGIGTVRSVKTSGDRSYQFTDVLPLTGWNYYRIKAYNTSEYKFTNVKRIQFEDKSSWTLYPNPVTTQVNIVLQAGSAPVQLKLFDSNGKLLAAKKTAGATTVVLNTSQLAAGQYYIEYNNGIQREVKPFIKL
jgi:Secretion system C-terminal sorting domain